MCTRVKVPSPWLHWGAAELPWEAGLESTKGSLRNYLGHPQSRVDRGAASTAHYTLPPYGEVFQGTPIEAQLPLEQTGLAFKQKYIVLSPKSDTGETAEKP